MTQFTLTHHMANKPFLLLGLAAEYRSRRRRRWCDKHCGRPSDVYDTDRRTKLTALDTISRWLLLKKWKKSLFEPPFWALRGNLRTPSMALWKARVDFIFVVIELFRYLLWLRRYERKSVEVGVFRRGGSLWAQISERRGRRQPTILGIRVAEWLPFRVV